MKLVLETYWGDGYSCGGTTCLSFEAEDADALATLLIEKAQAAKDEGKWYFFVGEHELSVADYFYENGDINLPDVLTLEEWWKRNLVSLEIED